MEPRKEATTVRPAGALRPAPEEAAEEAPFAQTAPPAGREEDARPAGGPPEGEGEE